MKHLVYKIGITIMAVVLVWSCSKDDAPPPSPDAPAITGFTPKSGPVGTVITINGTNFSTTKEDNSVKVGSSAMAAITATDTKITAKVPQGAKTGKVSVTVDGETDTSGTFTVTEGEVENVAPTFGEESYAFEANEDIADDTVIGTVEATDANADGLTYAIATNDNGLFEINATGDISLATGMELDFETVTEHTITVSVTDGTETVEVEVTITVLNVADTLAEDPGSFVTTWQTDAASETIYIGLNNEYDYDFTIDWGDGTVEDIVMAKDPQTPMYLEHAYAEAKEHTVAISGDFPAIQMYVIYPDNGLELNLDPAPKAGYGLTGIEQWGTIQWQTMYDAFRVASTLEHYNATDAPDLSQVTTMRSMFRNASLFNADLSDWNVGNVTNMIALFKGAYAFNGDLSTWDLSSVTTMEVMFENATSFNGNISSWETGNVFNMFSMFNGATAFNGDISGWSVSSVENMSRMFRNATSFNSDISDWNIENVTYTSWMFSGAASFDQNLGNWDIGSIDHNDELGMFAMFDNSGMSASNFSNTLIGWSNFVAQNDGPYGVTLGNEGVPACTTQETFDAANNLFSNYGWDIVLGEGVNCQ